MIRNKDSNFPANGWANVSPDGNIHIHPTRIEEPECWVYVLAHCMAHLGLGHSKQKRENPQAWGLACEITVLRFLDGLRLGTPPPRLADLPTPHDFTIPNGNEADLYEHFCRRIDPRMPSYSLTASATFDFATENEPRKATRYSWRQPTDWEVAFAAGLQEAVASAVATAGGYEAPKKDDLVSGPTAGNVRRAREWFLNHYPLLGALAASFGVVIDTSASMSRVMLGESLGAVAAYAQARDVPAVRVISCDAAAYDYGYVDPDTIASRMELRGRGGTRLQPGINRLESAPDFPQDGPILIITDGLCDAFTSRRKLAIVLPAGRPFPHPTGSTPIFRFSER